MAYDDVPIDELSVGLIAEPVSFSPEISFRESDGTLEGNPAASWPCHLCTDGLREESGYITVINEGFFMTVRSLNCLKERASTVTVSVSGNDGGVLS